MIDAEKFGALTVWVERLESLRQRAIDLLPFMGTLALLALVFFQLQGVGQRLSAVEFNVADLRGDVTTLQTGVSVLKSDVAVLKSDVAALKTDMSAVRAQLDAIARKLDVRP